MTEAKYGESVWVCYEVNHPGEAWVTCGVVATEEDAEMWLEGEPNRKVEKMTLGVVEKRLA